MAQIRPFHTGDKEQLFALVRAFPTPTPPDWAAFAATLDLKLRAPCSFLAMAAVEAWHSQPSSTRWRPERARPAITEVSWLR